MRFPIVVSLILFTSACATRKEERIKSEIHKRIYMNMNNPSRLSPEIVTLEYPVNEVAPLILPNKFACLVGSAFGVAAISEDLKKVSFERARGNFPEIPVGAFGSNEDGTVMWGQEGYRGFLAYHFPSGTTINTVPDTYAEMVGAVAPKGRSSLVFVCMYYIRKRKTVYFVYDVANGVKAFDDSENPSSLTLFPVDENSFIGVDGVVLNGVVKFNWGQISFTERGFHPISENELTRFLSKKNIDMRLLTRSFSFEKGICIGTAIPGEMQMVIQWKNGFKDIRISPLVIQCPNSLHFGDVWEFSLDGRWLAARPEIPNADVCQLLLYHVDEKYPQGISPPIYGGTTPKNGRGCFVNHSSLGPLYVDVSFRPPALLVYKMNDVSKMLVK